MITVYRVQDADGRGPWKPGLSKYWIDENGPDLPETIIDLVGGINVLRSLPAGWHYGCACKSLDGLKKWFTEIEARRLEAIGYSPVSMDVEKIVKSSELQLLVASRRPFSNIAANIGWKRVFL